MNYFLHNGIYVKDQIAMNDTTYNKTNNCIESDRSVLEYFFPDSIRLDMPFILTYDKKLTIGILYLLHEGHHTEAVRLVDAWDKYGFVYLKVQELQTGRVNTLSSKLQYESCFWLWSLASLDFLIDLTIKTIKKVRLLN